VLSRIPSRVLIHAKSIAQESAVQLRGDRLRALSTRVDGAEMYSGLDQSSLALVGVRGSDRLLGSVNLVIPRFRANAVFAGTRTAIEVATSMCEKLGRPLRVIVIDSRFTSGHRKDAAKYLSREFGLAQAQVTLWSPEDLFENEVSSKDLWLVTHWTTAHAADVASRMGLIGPAQVVYLVQDYEPGFTPWSTQHALASSTYHAGFNLIVNSSPLASYLREHESLAVASDVVFRPHLDLDKLSQVASKRSQAASVRIMFYGRPSKPRNLFNLGVSALRVAVRALEVDGLPVTITSAGEAHENQILSRSKTLKSEGTLGWEAYFRRLSEVDVMLSLQYSPHPSHPPLDAVVSGARAVTNEFGGERSSLSSHLFAGQADPDSLGKLLVRAATESRTNPQSVAEPSVVERLGSPLTNVVESVLVQVRQGSDVG
jgi:hypothetical protein